MKNWLRVTGIFLFIFALGFILPAEARALQQAQEAAQEKAEEKTQEETSEKAQDETAEKSNRALSVTFSGELTNYFIYQSSAYFGKHERSWLETSLRLDGTLQYKDFKVEVSGIGLKTTGRDSYGTGTLPTGAPVGTPAPGTFPRFFVDKANIQLDRIGGLPLKATLSR